MSATHSTSDDNCGMRTGNETTQYYLTQSANKVCSSLYPNMGISNINCKLVNEYIILVLLLWTVSRAGQACNYIKIETGRNFMPLLSYTLLL